MQGIDIKQIVAGIDFSEWTQPVLKRAAELAERYGAGVTAAYADQFSPPSYFTERGIERVMEGLDAQRDAARRHLGDTVRKGIGGSVVAESRLVEKAPADGILSVAEDVSADLIVLGTHGHSGLNRLLLGSVAEKVVRRARVPVLTVRGAGDEAAACRLPFRRILCPMNYTDVAQESLNYAGDLARRFEADLTVMTCLEGEEGSEGEIEAHRQRMCDLVPEGVRTQCALNSVVRSGEAAEEILRTAREGEHDLLVIGAQHKPLLEATIFGTTSIRVMRHAMCPVFTVVRHRG